MSRSRENILKGLRALAVQTSVNVPAIVKSVDEQTQTCVVEIDKIDYEDVRLTAVNSDDNSKHSFIVPSVGSWVIVAFVENSETDAFIIAYSEVFKAVINADEIVFNNGDFKGMVKIEELIKKLNAIEKDINNLKQVFSSWITVANDGGAALKASAASWAGQTLQETTVSDIENKKIKQ